MEKFKMIIWFCVYIFGEVLGMLVLLNIFYIGDIVYFRGKNKQIIY